MTQILQFPGGAATVDPSAQTNRVCPVDPATLDMDELLEIAWAASVAIETPGVHPDDCAQLRCLEREMHHEIAYRARFSCAG